MYGGEPDLLHIYEEVANFTSDNSISVRGYLPDAKLVNSTCTICSLDMSTYVFCIFNKCE